MNRDIYGDTDIQIEWFEKKRYKRIPHDFIEIMNVNKNRIVTCLGIL